MQNVIREYAASVPMYNRNTDYRGSAGGLNCYFNRVAVVKIT